MHPSPVVLGLVFAVLVLFGSCCGLIAVAMSLREGETWPRVIRSGARAALAGIAVFVAVATLFTQWLQ